MNTPTPPLFVWYSTEESRAAGIVSLLAVAETVICVALYWLLWLKWGVTWHHWLIVVATPLLLMRSEASVKKGVAWFDPYWTHENELSLRSAKGFTFVTFSAALAFGIAWVSAQNWLADFTGLSLILRSAVVGLVSLSFGLTVAGGLVTRNAVTGGGALEVAATGAGAGAVALALAIAGAGTGATAFAVAGALAAAAGVERAGAGAKVLAIPGVGVGAGYFLIVWLRAIMTRSLATFSHPLAGLKAIPTNWRHFVWHSDLRAPPELLPGHKATALLVFLGEIKAAASQDPFRYLLYPIALPIFYLPVLLWRWSIKSTAWFYLPLLWVGRGWQNIHGEELLIWAKGYARKWLNITGVLLAAVLLIGSLVALIVPGELFDLQKTLRHTGAPLPMIGWAFVLDWQSLAAQPWQWFYLPSWMLTLTLFFLIDDHGTDIEKGAKAEPRLPALRRWMWVSNARTVLTNLGLLIAVWYFLAAVDAWGQVAELFS
ncbi:hypothetical protein [uncultured Hoeflea sp.]|uniref:hypothetical protein n=1 Tax=uncultured Hoeflea sp. TaxID=538666 RepID=UPI00262C17ED|nr:hypothetical protein [uncultured Hoeflea sp.]